MANGALKALYSELNLPKFMDHLIENGLFLSLCVSKIARGSILFA